MNKRLKKKIEKDNNKKRIEKILKNVSEQLTVEKIQYQNGYFVYNMGEHSVCYFDIKETPEWKYGIWLKKDGFYLFGEHRELIDKFRPSRTYISNDSDIDGFIDKVKQIRQNPKLYFVDSLTYGNALVEWKEHIIDDEVYVTGYQVTYKEVNGESVSVRDKSITQEDFVDESWNRYLDKKKQFETESESDRKFAFDFFKRLPKMFEDIEYVGIIDCNKGGCSCNPRYDIKVIVSRGTTLNRIYELFDEIDELVTSEDRNGLKTSRHNFALRGVYEGKRELKNCDYKYQ